MAGFLFIHLFIFGGEEVYFICGDKIGSYAPSSGKLSFLDPGQGSLAGSFTRDNDGLWFVPQRKGHVTFFNFSGKKYFSKGPANRGQAFFLPSYFLTLSSAFKEGFPWEVYTLDKKMRLLRQGELDLFISQAREEEGEIWLSGADRQEVFDGIYALNPVTGESRWVFRTPKEPGFLKFISHNQVLVIYYSAPFEGREGNHLWVGNKNGSTFKEVPLSLPGELLFYGPGFFLEDLWIIPAINREKEIVFVCLNEEMKPEKMIKAPTGIYKIIKKTKDKLYFLGYNYYKGAGDFYFGVFQHPRDSKDPFTVYSLP